MSHKSQQSLNASQCSRLQKSPPSRQVSGEEMFQIIHAVVNDPDSDVQIPLPMLNADTSGSSQANSLPASIDLLSPSPKTPTSSKSPQFKRPDQPSSRKERKSNVETDANKENIAPPSPPSSASSSPTNSATMSPVIRSSNASRAMNVFHQSPQRSNRLISDHLSPRLGLPTPSTSASAVSLERFPHAHPYPPPLPVGDLKGTMAMIVEMRPFDLRPQNSITPERQHRERGRTYYYMSHID